MLHAANKKYYCGFCCATTFEPAVCKVTFVMLQENPHGFFPIRNPESKWYIPYEDMSDDVVPWKTV